jgi:hypothetical protein
MSAKSHALSQTEGNQVELAASRSLSDRAVALLDSRQLLSREDKKAYDELQAAIHAAVSPSDIFEEIWIRDLVAHQWDVMRLRRFIDGLIVVSQQEVLEKIVYQLRSTDDVFLAEASKALALKFTLKDVDAVKEVNQLLRAADLTWDVVWARTVALNIGAIEHIDRMIKTSEKRRDKTLRHIESHRKSFGPALRAVVKEIEDAEFRVIEPAVETRKAA